MPEPSRTLRFATPADAATLHELIVALAVYEREPDAVEVDPATLAAQLAATPPPFECVLCEEEGRAVGIALFFHNYSTWRGKRGLYLEDLFVRPEARGRGHGRALLAALAKLAVARDCARMEWSVLDWNAPSIAFYEALGSVPMSGWTTHRLTGPALEALADQGPAVQ